MTRIHTAHTTLHTVRTLAIAGFIICTSFLAYAAPASAQFNPYGQPDQNDYAWQGVQTDKGKSFFSPYGQPDQNDYAWRGVQTDKGKSFSSSDGSGEHNLSGSGFGNSGVTAAAKDNPNGVLRQAESPTEQIARLEERIKQLHAMKSQLEKLIDALKTSSLQRQSPHCRPLAHTKPLVAGIRPQNGERGCIDDKPLSVGSSTAPTAGQSHFVDDSGMRPGSRGNNGGTTTNSGGTAWSQGGVYTDYSFGKSSGGVSSPGGVGIVHGASTSLDAEFAASLEDIRGTLVDLANDLNA